VDDRPFVLELGEQRISPQFVFLRHRIRHEKRRISAVRSWPTGIITLIGSIQRGKEHNGNANKSHVRLSTCGPVSSLGFGTTSRFASKWTLQVEKTMVLAFQRGASVRPRLVLRFRANEALSLMLSERPSSSLPPHHDPASEQLHAKRLVLLRRAGFPLNTAESDF